MPDLRRITFVGLSSILLLGTVYSVAKHTYLDTSDPLLALSNHPHVHPLSATNYFARKDNILNTLFIKRAWGWTTLVALALLVTAPSPTADGASIGTPRRRRVGVSMSKRERLAKWVAATSVWLLFVVWFFGPGVLERLTSLSGGECVVRLPGPSGEIITVPAEYCITNSIISPATHPEVFLQASPGLLLPEGTKTSDWRTRPRLMRGHDVSGHVFLLTMSLLFLADMVRPSLRLPAQSVSDAHRYALYGAGALMTIWTFAIYTTSLYFHTPFEKLTGYLVGLVGFLVTQLPIFQDPLPEILSADVGMHED